ncbi:MAG: hypothetical protein CMJ78_16955 [Planctomycetaceae bacterium]|nr:hypothetical protein [Planctomycetaceae bacterium]
MRILIRPVQSVWRWSFDLKRTNMRFRVHRLIAIAVILLNINALMAAEKLSPIDQKVAEKISFRADVWPIVKRHCWGCHSGAGPKGGLNMDTVADMLKGGDSGPLFAPGKADDSLLVEMIIGDEPEMPQQKPPLSAAKINILRGWVHAGAKDDSVASDKQLSIRIPEKYRFAPAITSVAMSADGKQIAAAVRSEIVLITVEGDAPPRRVATTSDLVTHVEFSPDGKTVAACGGAPARYGRVQFFNVADGKQVLSRDVGHDTLFRGNFSPDGKNIALGGADGAVHIVPFDAKTPLRKFDLHSDWVLDVAYTPDGKMLVSGSRDKATKISSVETGKLLRSVDSSSELISSVATDANFAISAGRARLPISFELKIALQGVQVSGAGNGARPISRRAQYAKNMEGQPGIVLDLAISGDRKVIAIAGAYGDVRTYNIANRQRTALITNVPAPIYGVAMNQDATRLVLGSKSGQVQIYQLPEAKLIKSISPVPVQAPAEVASQ